MLICKKRLDLIFLIQSFIGKDTNFVSNMLFEQFGCGFKTIVN